MNQELFTLKIRTDEEIQKIHTMYAIGTQIAQSKTLVELQDLHATYMDHLKQEPANNNDLYAAMATAIGDEIARRN